VTHAQLVEFLRAIHARPAGTGAILNLIRGAKVRGAADLDVLTDIVADPSLRLELARHGLDETRHAYRLARRMDELGFAPVRLPREMDRVAGLFARCRARDVHDVYEKRSWLGDVELLEFLTAVLLPELDAVAKLAANHEALAGDLVAAAAVEEMVALAPVLGDPDAALEHLDGRAARVAHAHEVVEAELEDHAAILGAARRPGQIQLP